MNIYIWIYICIHTHMYISCYLAHTLVLVTRQPRNLNRQRSGLKVWNLLRASHANDRWLSMDSGFCDWEWSSEEGKNTVGEWELFSDSQLTGNQSVAKQFTKSINWTCSWWKISSPKINWQFPGELPSKYFKPDRGYACCGFIAKANELCWRTRAEGKDRGITGQIAVK